MTGFSRFYFLGALSIAAGTLLALAEPTFVASFPMEGAAEVFTYLFSIIGAGHLITGGTTLWKYLVKIPLRRRSAHDHRSSRSHGSGPDNS